VAQYMVDTSALVKYYHPEIGSPRVIALADDPSNVLFISRIGLDVRFISSLPVMQQPAYKVWADKRPVQIVWAVR
jgi:hypothetical protein